MESKKFISLISENFRWSNKLEQWVPKKDQKERACLYCPKNVKNQTINCHAHQLGTPNQHFKHRCSSCGFYVFDGSFKKDPRRLRSPMAYIPVEKLGRPKKKINE